MPISTQDFVTGIDFTALIAANGSQHNQLVNLGTPGPDAGLNIPTIDSALNAPVVPDAVVNAKWKRYLWKRSPHATATNQSPLLYAWSDNAVSDATFLKWIQITSGDHEQIVDNTADILAVRSLIKDKATLAYIVSGGSAPNAVINKNTRAYNFLQNYNSLILEDFGSSAAGLFRCLISGPYLVSAWAVGYMQSHQLYLVRNDTNAVVASGSDMYNNGIDLQTTSHIDGVVTLLAGVTYRFDHYFVAAQVTGLGKYSGNHPSALAYNVYMNAVFTRQLYV